MNLRFRFLITLCVVIFVAQANLARAQARSDLVSAVVQTSLPLPISVAAGQSLKIRNFTQDGGTTAGSVSVVTPTAPSKTVLMAVIQHTTVIPQLQAIEKIIIAGPATVTVTAGSDVPGGTGGTCFITYRTIP